MFDITTYVLPLYVVSQATPPIPSRIGGVACETTSAVEAAGVRRPPPTRTRYWQWLETSLFIMPDTSCMHYKCAYTCSIMSIAVPGYTIHTISIRQAWLLSGALNVCRVFSAVRCSVLAVIDFAAIAITVSNPGEWRCTVTSTSHALTCMYVARRRYLTARNVQKRYH